MANQNPQIAGLNVTQSSLWPNQKGLSVSLLFSYVANQTDTVNAKLQALQSSGSSLSITDMFQMQMIMNRLAQFSEMASSVVSSVNGSLQSIAQKIK